MMETQPQEKTLAKIMTPQQALDQLRADPVVTISQNYDALAAVANVMFPMTAVDSLPPMTKPATTIVVVNTSDKSKDTYFITTDQRGLSKHVIMRMLAAAGYNWRTKKITPDSELENIRWAALVWGRQPDGTPIQGTGSKAWNWEKCQKDFVRKALARPKQGETTEQSCNRGLASARAYREFADEQTETKALLRAARAALGIQTSYSPADLAKPFLFVKAVPDLDVSDPEIKAKVVDRMLDASSNLYPHQPPAMSALPEPEFPEIPPEPSELVDRPEEIAMDGELDLPESQSQEAPAQQIADPFKNPAAPAPATCHKCDKLIEGTTIEGQVYSAEQIAEKTAEQMGKPACWHCFAAWRIEERKKAAGAK